MRLRGFLCFYFHGISPLQETLRPIYHRAAWSFTCAFYGRRPIHGPSGTTSDLSFGQAQLASSKPELSARFAVTEYKGDQKYMRETFGLLRNWQCGLICHRCNAARLSGRGPLFTQFGTPWERLSNVEALLHVFPASPNPMILIPGFHIRMLTLGCITHASPVYIVQLFYLILWFRDLG